MFRSLSPEEPWLPLVCCLALFLVARFTNLDAWVTGMFFDSTTAAFPLRHSWLFETLLHDWARNAVFGGALGVALMLLINKIFDGDVRLRRALTFVFTSMVFTTTLVATIKYGSNVHCPYDLTEYGGRYARTMLEDAFTGGVGPPGRCWPSGHASAGFCLLGFFFAARWLGSRWSRPILLLALVTGGLFTFSQTARGAHFITHGLWTGLFVWLGNISLARLLLKPERDSSSLSARVAVPLRSHWR